MDLVGRREKPYYFKMMADIMGVQKCLELSIPCGPEGFALQNSPPLAFPKKAQDGART